MQIHAVQLSHHIRRVVAVMSTIPCMTTGQVWAVFSWQRAICSGVLDGRDGAA